MAQRAAKLYPISSNETPALPEPALRDFTQPWLDLNDKAMLVTGGTGSFGKHFVKTVLETLRPRKLIDLQPRRAQAVRDAAAVPDGSAIRSCATSSATCATATGSSWRCATSTIVVHAAALKQVPAAEYNPFECIHTNVLGAENVVSRGAAPERRAR